MIIKYPNEILITPSKDVSLKRGKEIAKLLKDELLDHKDGVGLAAPQIGLNENVFVALGKVYINPKIQKYSPRTEICPESCLSIPRKIFDVERSNSVIIKYMNMDGKLRVNKVDDFEARVVQHEYDHLLGKLINQK